MRKNDTPTESRAEGTGDQRRWPALDAVRGIAALSVALFHFTRVAVGVPGPMKSILDWGFLGVPAFFLVSGVVITNQIVGRDIDAPRFFARRMMRLAPPFLAMSAAVPMLNYLSSLSPGFRGDPWMPPSIAAVACNLLYTCDLIAVPWFLVVAWSLAIEVQFYGASAVLAGLRGRLPAVLLMLAIAAVVISAPFSSAVLVSKYAPHFALGALVWHHGNGLMKTITALPIAVALLVVAVFTVPMPDVAVLAATAAVVAATRRWTPPAVVRWLGSVSYSIYLVHVPIGGRVVNLMMREATSPLAQTLVVMAATGGTLVVATLFHRWVELPSVAWSHRLAYTQARTGV